MVPSFDVLLRLGFIEYGVACPAHVQLQYEQGFSQGLSNRKNYTGNQTIKPSTYHGNAALITGLTYPANQSRMFWALYLV